VSEATGAAQNQGRARVTGRGGTSGSDAKRSNTVHPNHNDGTGPARDDATVEAPMTDDPRDAAPPETTPEPPAPAPPAPGSPSPGPPGGDADSHRGIPWEPRPPAPEPPRPAGAAQWTSTVQPSGTAANRSSSPFGPAYGSEAPPAPPPPPPPIGTPPPGPSRSGPGLRGRAMVARARAGKRTASGKTTSGKAPRRAHLQVSRFEPWSVMKFSFIMSLVCFVVLLVAVTVLYMILSGLGVFDAISSTINDLTREQGAKAGGLDAASWFSFARVFGYTALIGSLNVLLITALATVWAVIYNLSADFVGGVEVTLKEAE
jgi:hypothetical protein